MPQWAVQFVLPLIATNPHKVFRRSKLDSAPASLMLEHGRIRHGFGHCGLLLTITSATPAPAGPAPRSAPRPSTPRISRGRTSFSVGDAKSDSPASGPRATDWPA